MFYTIRAIKSIMKSNVLFWFCLLLFIIMTLVTSIFVFEVKEKIQNSMLSILSIVFPLIAGFLTFGRESLKRIKKVIQKINENDNAERGVPLTNRDRRTIKDLKLLSDGFIKIVISAFYVSFILIMILLVSNFNDFNFYTSNEINSIDNYLESNIINLLLKTTFFYYSYIMLINTVFLIYFILRISKDDLLDL